MDKFTREVNSYRLCRLKGGKEKRSKLVEIMSEDQLPQHDNLFCLLPEHIHQLSGRLLAAP